MGSSFRRGTASRLSTRAGAGGSSRGGTLDKTGAIPLVSAVRFRDAVKPSTIPDPKGSSAEMGSAGVRVELDEDPVRGGLRGGLWKDLFMGRATPLTGSTQRLISNGNIRYLRFVVVVVVVVVVVGLFV